jgi:hypothetical protein
MYNIITGEKIQSLADITLVTNKIKNFHKNFDNFITNYIILDLNKNISNEELKKINNSKSIFIYSHLLPYFFEHIYDKLDNSFILLSHNSDDSVDIKYLKYLNQNKILKWYAQNINISHPKLVALPIGIANSQWKHGELNTLEHTINKNIAKTKLLYLNFKINTNRNVRKSVYELFKNKKFITVNNNLSYKKYLEELASHKFCIVPPGNGLDCHRTWECLYLGVIPIVFDCIMNQQFSHLPILIVDNWNEVTEDYLNSKYSQIWCKEYPMDYLNLEYWKNKFKKSRSKRKK